MLVDEPVTFSGERNLRIIVGQWLADAARQNHWNQSISKAWYTVVFGYFRLQKNVKSSWACQGNRSKMFGTCSSQ